MRDTTALPGRPGATDPSVGTTGRVGSPRPHRICEDGGTTRLYVIDPMSEAPVGRSDEHRLVAQAQSGDRKAFDSLVRHHFADVYSLLFRLVGNHEDAEDLAQETFVRGYRSLAFFKAEGRFGAWLGRIALHLARDHHRRRQRGPFVPGLDPGDLDPGDLDHGSAEPGPVRELTRKELVALLGEAVGGLPRNLRAALVMRVLEGREYEEVAEVTGMTPGTVRTQVMKARRLLLRAIAPWIGRRES